MQINKELVKELANNCLSGKGSSYTKNDKQATQTMYDIVSSFLEKHDGTLETRYDGSLGQLFESMVKRVKFGFENGYYAKAHNADMFDGRCEWEIKVSVNSKDLATPLKEPMRTLFITPKGAYTITKKTMVEVFNNPEDYSDYIKANKSGGYRLKTKAIELGTYQTELSKALGF